MRQLRKRMHEEFDLRGTPTNTRKTYARCVERFAAHFGRSPARLVAQSWPMPNFTEAF
jgi:hypothetical protein